jgi:hypothetical protein
VCGVGGGVASLGFSKEHVLRAFENEISKTIFLSTKEQISERCHSQFVLFIDCDTPVTR